MLVGVDDRLALPGLDGDRDDFIGKPACLLRTFGLALGRGGKGVKGIERKNGSTSVDAPHRLVACDTHDHLLLFTSRGRVYGLQAHEVAARSREWRGLPARNVVDLHLDQQVTTVIPVESFEDDYIILGTRRGYVKKTRLSHFQRVRRSGLLAFNLRDDDELVEAAFAHAGDDVIVTATDGRTVRFAVDTLREASRVSGGVRGINLDGESLIGLHTVEVDTEILTVTAGGFGKRTAESEYPTKGRAGKGMIGHKVSDETGPVVGMAVVRGDEALVVISAAGKILRTEVGQLRVCGRSTKGVKVMNSDEGIAAIAVVDTNREFGQRQ